MSASEVPPDPQRLLDARCVRYRHHERSLRFCENPRCPAFHPELWSDFVEMEGALDKESAS